MSRHNQHPGMGSHQSARMGKGEWLTPPAILEALGPYGASDADTLHECGLPGQYLSLDPIAQ